jgi:hypothetical protein
MVRLEVCNSEEDISDYKMMQRVEYFACRRCGHKWAITLQDMMDDPSCRKCGK